VTSRRRASTFAAALLMPQWLFVREHARCGGDVEELGRTFATSAAATERRVLALFGDS
jgi:predicted transcriptional regulator